MLFQTTALEMELLLASASLHSAAAYTVALLNAVTGRFVPPGFSVLPNANYDVIGFCVTAFLN